MSIYINSLFKKIILVLFVVLIGSCSMLTNDKFVYIGHGDETFDYQLYYDKTRKLFVLVDKRKGCFQKDDTGTCLAFNLEQAKHFREKVLAKMIKINLSLKQGDYGKNHIVSEIEKAGITTINKPIEIGNVYATPVRQIMMERQQQYHLVRGDFKIAANLVAILITDEFGKKKIKVAYTIDFPEIIKKYNTNLTPFIVDPKYLYNHMTMDAINEAEFKQNDILKNQKKVTKDIDNYLKKIVDNQPS